jgi:hypothetical protein
VVARPRAVFVTEAHVTGWLAIVWASLAVAPLKRFNIEFPFVAEKAIPRREKRVSDIKCRASEISSTAALRAIYAVIARYSWPFPVVLDQWLNNFFRGIRQAPCENTP